MALFDSLFGKKEETQQLQQLTPEQQQVMSQLLQGLGGPLASGLEGLQGILSGSPEALEAFQAPVRREFEEQTLPGIAEQFAGAGALRSSGFGRAATGAGAQLEENLSAQKAGLQQNALSQLMQLLGLGTQPQAETVLRPGTPGILGSALGSGLGVASGGLGAGLAGGLGSVFGGGRFGQGFGRGTSGFFGG